MLYFSNEELLITLHFSCTEPVCQDHANSDIQVFSKMSGKSARGIWGAAARLHPWIKQGYSNSVCPHTLEQGRAAFHPAHWFLSLWPCQQQDQAGTKPIPAFGTTGCSLSPSKAAVSVSHSLTGLFDANTLPQVVNSVPRLAKG